jgi:histidinol dehydrogenase
VLRLRFTDKGFSSALTAFGRVAEPSAAVSSAVAVILADVRARGDQAVLDYTEKFDGVRLQAGDLKVKPAELSAAFRRLSPANRRALNASRAAIIEFNKAGLPESWAAENRDGALVGEKFNPIRRVGLYVPSGLVSTVLMTAVLAKVAGCPEIAVCTPPDKEGKISDGLLGALHVAGVSEVYRIGGVQAVGAMAFGTATVPAVDKVFGPGNAYVCEAKRQVFGIVGIESLPGPSEVMIVADDSARADFAAADLLAQAEHGSGSEKIYLVATSAGLIDAIQAEAEAQLPGLSRNEKIRRVLDQGFLAVEVGTLAQAAEVANRVAPEHLELLIKDSAVSRMVRSVTTAGAIMIGNDTPTALGDFLAGPSHVLPTGGSGRFLSGLRVTDFIRRTSVVAYDRGNARRAAPTAAAFAAMERLDAHGRSVAVRAESED